MNNIGDGMRLDAGVAPRPGSKREPWMWSRLRSQFGGRRGLILIALVVIGLGMALNWSWLAAIGAAPIILALAPCAAMCGLGLCMKGGGGSSCSSDNAGKADASPAKISGS